MTYRDSPLHVRDRGCGLVVGRNLVAGRGRSTNTKASRRWSRCYSSRLFLHYFVSVVGDVTGNNSAIDYIFRIVGYLTAVWI